MSPAVQNGCRCASDVASDSLAECADDEDEDEDEDDVVRMDPLSVT